MQTWQVTASSSSNLADTLKGASSFTCQGLTTSKQMPWHGLAPPSKPYQPTSPFSTSLSRLPSLRQNQILSSCRLLLKQSDSPPKFQQSVRELWQAAQGLQQSHPARGLHTPARGLQQSARGLHQAARGLQQSHLARGLHNPTRGLQQSARGLQQCSKWQSIPTRRLPTQPPSYKWP